MICCLALLTTKNGVTYPLTILAFLGFHRCTTSFTEVRNDAAVLRLLLCFGCLWLPLLLALPDSVDQSRSAQTVLSYIRYFFAGVFIIHVVKTGRNYERLLLGSVVVVSFWTLDAMLQLFTGDNIFGYPHDSLQLSGIFYPKLRLGLLTAVLLPILFEGLRRHGNRYTWIKLLSLPALAAILLSANRNAWMMGTVALIGFAVYIYRLDTRPTLRSSLLAAAAALIFLISVTVINEKPLAERFANTTEILSSDYATIDRATSYRLSLWKTALTTFERHWFNGVGPRGFRTVYRDMAAPDDFWMNRFGRGQTHPHQFVLETAAETGVLGLAGLLLFWLSVLRVRGSVMLEGESAPWLLAVVVAAFPLNAHLAFYSTYWSSVLWWVLPVYLAIALRPASSETTTVLHPPDAARNP